MIYNTTSQLAMPFLSLQDILDNPVQLSKDVHSISLRASLQRADLSPQCLDIKPLTPAHKAQGMLGQQPYRL